MIHKSAVLFVTLLSLLFVASASLARGLGEPFDHSHAAWTELLRKHVHGDRVDYAGLKKDKSKLDAYLASQHAVNPKQLSQWSREQRFAFWINVYNAHCVALVVEHYPVDSIKDIGGFFSSVWKKEFIDMPSLHPSGKSRKLSLEDVEHQILRPTFKDARVHAAINCASESCPPLRAEAFVAAQLEAQLDEQVRAWLADRARNKFDAAKPTAEVSAIFDWFKEDFIRDGGSVAGWLAKYAPEHAAVGLKSGKVELRFLDYSWKLNEVKR